VKPLYYWHDDTTLVFASTPGVIARWAGLPPNLEYAVRGIRFKYYEDDGDIAPYAGMRALPPAHLLRVGRGDRRLKLELRRYYDLPARASALRAELANVPMPELEGRLLELLRSACELRCRSDVALGVSVSGGVDSSAVAALLTEGARPLVGYSFADPDDAGSEGPLVAELARATGMQPRYVQLRGREALAELFWATLGAQDAPFPHASIMAQYAVFRAARADGTIVLLGGQGGDEAFMGYRKFFLFYAQSIFRRRRVSALAHLVATVLPLAPSIGRRAGLFVAERRRYTKRGDGMGSLLRLPTLAPGQSMGMADAHGLEERQALDVMRFSLPTLLRYEDRNSMGNSVESRLPFMDHRVIEFGLALPVRAKLGNGYGKLILRRALAGSIPDRIRCNRDKRGFDVDQRAWIRGGLGAEIRSALARRRDAIAELLPSDAALDTLFGDERLERDPQAFKEAVTLIWLGDRM
jgi:asparagine synthase (glutamine-hydrolysing)